MGRDVTPIKSRGCSALHDLLREARPGTWTSEPSETPHTGAVRTSGAGLIEGWRGTIAHRVELTTDGRLDRVKIVDPSFLTWPALLA